MFMFSGKGTQFAGWMNDTQTNADCSLLQTRYQQACACGESEEETNAAEDIISDAHNNIECEWATGTNPYSCSEYCQ
jgi:hypothetical protein